MPERAGLRVAERTLAAPRRLRVRGRPSARIAPASRFAFLLGGQNRITSYASCRSCAVRSLRRLFESASMVAFVGSLCECTGSSSPTGDAGPALGTCASSSDCGAASTFFDAGLDSAADGGADSTSKPCSSNADCGGTSFSCLYPVSGGCNATRVCLRVDPSVGSCTAVALCGCDGKNFSDTFCDKAGTYKPVARVGVCEAGSD